MIKRTMISFDPGQINDNARWLLEVVAHYSFVRGILNRKNMTVILYEDFFFGEDDEIDREILLISVEESFTWSEHAREYGVNGLDPLYWSGVLSSTGNPIPNEEYIQRIIECSGDEEIYRVFKTPEWILEQVEGGQISGVESINLIGDEYARFVENGKFFPPPDRL